jgi:hypothetical protein
MCTEKGRVLAKQESLVPSRAPQNIKRLVRFLRKRTESRWPLPPKKKNSTHISPDLTVSAALKEFFNTHACSRQFDG